MKKQVEIKWKRSKKVGVYDEIGVFIDNELIETFCDSSVWAIAELFYKLGGCDIFVTASDWKGGLIRHRYDKEYRGKIRLKP